jgi:hypothetical protein
MAPTRSHRQVPRLPVIIGLVAVIMLFALVDRQRGTRAAPATALVQAMPVAAPTTALSSSWFCAGAFGRPTGVADGQLVVANSTTRPVSGTATLVSSQGTIAIVPVNVGPLDRTVLSESPVVPPNPPSGSPAPAPSFVGAIVTLNGGGAAVEQVISGDQGLTATPCGTSGSDHWYFADGTTQEGASLVVSLLNPYPEDAIADLSFTTEQGVEAPNDFQGIVVPAGGIAGVDVGSHLRRRDQVATTVSTRAGRVVAWKTMAIKAPSAISQAATQLSGLTAAGVQPSRAPGLTLVLGTLSAGTTWWWPDGVAADGVIERYQIYNPGQKEADVSLGLALDQGSADPFTIKVLPRGTATIVSNNEPRVPKGVGHAAALVSTNGIGVVAERTIDAVAPSPRDGLAELMGSRLTSPRWLLPAGSATPALDEWVTFFNPGRNSVSVSVVGLSVGNEVPLGGLSNLTLPPGRRLAVRINESQPNVDLALLVKASGDIGVERDLYRVKGIGLSATIGVPLSP